MILTLLVTLLLLNHNTIQFFYKNVIRNYYYVFNFRNDIDIIIIFLDHIIYFVTFMFVPYNI